MKRLACSALLSLALACSSWSTGNWSTGPVQGAVERHSDGGADAGGSTRVPVVRHDEETPAAVFRATEACGALGRACGPGTCPDGLDCENGACVRSGDMCGGAVAAACPKSAPVCLIYPWATGWPCVTRADRDCICATPAGRAGFEAECGAAARP